MDKLRMLYSIMTDRRNIVLVFFIVIALGITWATIGQIEYNYRLEQQQTALEEEVALLELKSQNQQLNNQFYATDYYQELSARRQLGLVRAGETTVVLSASDLEQRESVIANITQDIQPQAATVLSQPSVLEQWFSFFSGDNIR